MWKGSILSLVLMAFVCGCCHVPRQIEPTILAPPHPKEIHREKRNKLCLPADFSTSPFPPLTPEELRQERGKEYYIGLCFAADFDLYRAITEFKRALCLLPMEIKERRLEIEYAVALAYYLGKKYIETVYTIESGALTAIDESFPAFCDLLLILYDSYTELGKHEHAAHILNLIEGQDVSKARSLTLLSAVKCADFNSLCLMEEDRYHYLHAYVARYQKEAKSITKAQTLDALLPGAGYWYVGLRETAATALLINSLFIAAAAHFFTQGHTAAGIITTSFEAGWYFGGISGAGYAAKYYNEQLYCTYANKIIQREECFPIMMLKYTF